MKHSTNRAGSTLMETVIVAVLLAASLIIGVMAFSRGVLSGLVTSTSIVVGEAPEKVIKDWETRRADRQEDVEKAKIYQGRVSGR